MHNMRLTKKALLLYPYKVGDPFWVTHLSICFPIRCRQLYIKRFMLPLGVFAKDSSRSSCSAICEYAGICVFNVAMFF